MKSDEKKVKSDYLLLHTILGRYLSQCETDSSIAPRFLSVEKIDDMVQPFKKIKLMIQHIEWLSTDRGIDELLEYMTVNTISIEELIWAIDMFAVEKQKVLDKIIAKVRENG